MPAEPTFRPATKADAAALAVLVDIAGEGMPAYMWSTLAAPGQRFVDDVFQEALTASRLGERSTAEDAVQLLAYGLTVGVAPAIEGHCRHVPTPRQQGKAGG